MSIKYIIDNSENLLATQSISGTISVDNLTIDNLQSTSGLTRYVVVDNNGNTFYQTGGGGGTSAAAANSAAMPAAPKAAGTAAPEIQTGGGQNPNMMIAQTIANAQKPVRAYVVSGDVTTTQALDRRTNKAATFSTGTG